MTDIVEQLRNWITDWNGAPMQRGEPPRDGIHCDVLYDAITEIEDLRAQFMGRALEIRNTAKEPTLSSRKQTSA